MDEGLCAACLLRQAALETGAFDTGPVTVAEVTTEPPTVENVAAAFPHLEIVERIGRGGMGSVFKARQPKLNRYVALKILAPHLAGTPAPTFAERFLREAQLLARLSHPNIVTVYDFGQSGGFYYLMMEFVDGVNLRQAIRSEHFTPEQTLSIVPKICEALQYAHEEGVLHRDIKPENILLDTKGRVKIADFGIAKLKRAGDEAQRNPRTESWDYVEYDSVPGSLTRTDQILGTPNYMAPEQIERPSEVDHRADIYSLGVVFYELLTGELPLGRFAPPSEKSDTSPNVDRIVLKALEKERERRQQSAGEMKTEIETVTRLPAKESKPNRRFAVWGLILLILAVALPWGPLTLLAQMRDRRVSEIRDPIERLQEQKEEAFQQRYLEWSEDFTKRRSELKTFQGEALLEAEEVLHQAEKNFVKRLEEERRTLKEEVEIEAKRANEIATNFHIIAHVFLTFCGILAAVGTIFGWIHLVRIRQSTEKSGFWLGLFVALIALVPATWCGIQLLFLGPYDPPFRGVMATIGNITAIVVPLWLIARAYRWASGTPPFQSAVEKVVVVEKPKPIAEEVKIETEPTSEKPGLWRRAVAEVKTWPIWATILVVCIAGPMALYVPVLLIAMFVGSVLFVADGGLRLHENWPVISPLITPVGLMLLVLVGVYIYYRKRKRK